VAFVVLYDANVLYGGLVRDLLVRVGIGGLVQAKWTSEILDEAFENLKTNRPNLEPARLRRTRDMMNNAVRDCLVTGYEPLIAGLTLPDPDDRHVLAAAIRAGAQLIVTDNLTHFPEAQLQPFGIAAQGPDEFLLGLVELNAGQMWEILDSISAALHRPDTREGMLVRLKKNGLAETARELEAVLQSTQSS
jgi:predicted nucleic acid-binding protein